MKSLSNFGFLRGVKIKRYCLVIYSVFFADGAIFFEEANEVNCMRFVECMSSYCTGRKPDNYNKSSVYLIRCK